MSSAVGSGKQTNLFHEDSEALYDPYYGFALSNLCPDVPWPEWTDAELNAEAWDEGKAARAVTVAGPKVSSSITVSVFDDPQPPKLPPLISQYVRAWKRPQDVFPGSTLTVYDPTNVDFELQLPSSLSSECNFLKVFVEQLTILQFYAFKYGFQVELETPSFISNTQGDVWCPWHHVYALCKAGKGQVHKPLYCPYGKYVLRLFYMGVWRRFIVDDKIPCDVEGNCLLPTTQIPGELWPILLTKGILKILSLTPTNDFSVTDFPLVSAFTGWTHGHFATENKSSDQVWRRLDILAPHFEQLEKQSEEKKSVGFSRNPIMKKESSKRDSRKSPDREEPQGERFCFVFGSLIGFSFEEDLSVDCTVAITMTRDAPLVKASKREGTKPWKRIRWIYWAKEKGLWIDENQLPPYRRLQIITFFPGLTNLLAPDPKLEAALYDIPIEDDSGAEEDSTGESKMVEPEQWCDYFRFLEYLTGVNVFFKPSYFISNFKISCLREKVIESPPITKGTSKPPPPQNVFILPTSLKQTCNEPIFLLCEALTGIFLCISLWVCPQKTNTCYGYLESDQPKILKVGHASLVVELFDWRFVHKGEIVGLTKTVGYSSVVLNLKPGRHILKLWLYSDSSYVVDINSNVNVAVSTSPKLRCTMNNESQQIMQYIHNVSSSFLLLTQKFGKPELPMALRDFYETIKPRNDSVKGYYKMLDDFIENFLNCIVLVLSDIIPNTEEVIIMMWALRSLFINPDIRCDLALGKPLPSFYGGSSAKKPPKKMPSFIPERTLSEIIKDVAVPEDVNKVIIIQKIFRGYRIRLLWKYQSPGRKEFKPFTERLKKICDAIFAPPKREVEVGKLLRRIVMNKPDLLTTFRFHNDFSNVLQVEEFSGKIPNVEPFSWVPIARFVIACHLKGIVLCAFYLSCNLEQSVIQGFDNDSGKEIFRVSNTVSPHYYHSNVRGYTILAFGWNEANVKTVNWRLEMVKMKHFESMHLCNILMNPTCQPYPMPTLDLFEIKNFYVPNSKFRIFRCLIKIQKKTLLTLRLSLSYTNVQFMVVIKLDDKIAECCSESNSDSVIAEMTSSNGAVIVPTLLLEYIECPWVGESYPDSDYTVYVVEAYVLNNSWPLTKQEWGLVEPIRVNGESWKDSTTSVQSKRGGSESRKKLNRTSKRSLSEQKIENPFWLLQALNDSSSPEAGEMAVIEEDKSYAESVKAMKLQWEEKDPGRRKRGRELRMKFLYMMYLEEKRNQVFYGEYCGEESNWDDDANVDPQVILDRLSSFTYLSSDLSPTRYIRSPRILPIMPLREMLLKYRIMSEISSSSSSQEEDVDSRYTEVYTESTDISFKIVGDLIEDMEYDRKEFLRQFLYYRDVLTDWFNEELKLSNLLMEQAYDARANLVERMMR